MNKIIRIDNINAEPLRLYHSLKEVQLKTACEPYEGFFIAESRKVIERAIADGYEPVSVLVDDNLTGKYFDLINISPETYVVPETELKQITGFELTGGILCCMRRKPLRSAAEICRNAHRVAILERVMNPTNVGAIIRSAAAMNIDAVLLTPDCSDPLYRRSARVSMGTVFQIPWTFINHSLDIRELGFKTAAMALTDKTIDISDNRLKTEERLAIILGSEGDGLMPETISGSDYVVRIPMREIVDSLNVAAAGAVAFWELRMK